MEHIPSIAGCIVVGIAIFLVLGFVIRLLWNWLLPSISAVKKITYVQALGILLLAKILFGGFGHFGHHWRGHGCYEKNAHCSSSSDCSHKGCQDKNENAPQVK